MTRAALACVLFVVLAIPIATSASTSRPKAPALTGVTVDAGTRLSLSSLRGKPVMINVWSSW